MKQEVEMKLIDRRSLRSGPSNFKKMQKKINIKLIWILQYKALWDYGEGCLSILKYRAPPKLAGAINTKTGPGFFLDLARARSSLSLTAHAAAAT